MQAKIKRDGDYVMVEIPEDFLAQAGFQIGDQLDWIVGSEGALTLYRLPELTGERARDRFTLEELLEGVPEVGCDGEYDWGPPQGVEFW